jgi:hypothetical protein
MQKDRKSSVPSRRTGQRSNDLAQRQIKVKLLFPGWAKKLLKHYIQALTVILYVISAVISTKNSAG